MKRLLSISLICGLVSSLSAANFDTKVSLGASSAKIDGESYTQYGGGYTSNTSLDNGILLGFGNSIYYGNVRSGTEVTTVDMDLRAGYEIVKNLRGYGLGTGVYQYMDDNSATGLGYGASLEYKINNNVAIEGSYKTTNMRYSTNDYDYSTSNFAVKFNY
ncbi:MAG: outer membrane beta-barrel protein [Aliarcobacter sp.]|nr:outer membrane beta-barrel protein [Aliarcobacter sp.]